ncbi:MAG: integration host factor subunit alpha [Nitrospirae bacterium]|jgi:integration host factor subunit alpha|nr:integration host factor subunit alpha [Nitrospirota bacterium]MCL5063402.1 integration host factor subunit alpha [Nitrospirota bacterium]MDA8213780.1 integration host factor subunit alpha [Nitrospiraceae bacterium]MDA8337841.1 integration host factor subunit alpha [Nitrospiraceae bacterium]
MTKADIVNLVFEKVGLPKNEAQEMVETVFDAIKQTLIAGESIKISGFGTFNVRKKGSRVGRNPKTKEEVEITPRRVVTFKASDQLKEIIEKM